MRKLYAFLLAAILFFTPNNASAQSCCKKPTEMQALAFNKAFKASHLPPNPISYTPEKGSMVQFPVPNGVDGNAFYVPADSPSNKVLFIFHEWWGLNDYIRKESEKWQKLLGGKVNVYAIDLYDGKEAVTPDEAGKLMGNQEPNRGESIVNGLLQRLGNGKQIATLGWCMGGSWSFTGAVAAGSEAVGCVMYYGFPEKNPDRIKALRCDVLYIRGSKDAFIKAEDVDAFKTKVKVSGHDFTLDSFDAVHAFANPSNPNYDVKSATDAQNISLKFLRNKLSLE